MLCCAAPSPFFWHTAFRCYSASCARASCCPLGPLELCGQQCPSVCPPALLTSAAAPHWWAWCRVNQCCCSVTSCLATSRATSCRSSVPQALLFTCPISGDRAPLRHLEWLKRHSVSGRLLSWGQAACLNPVLIPSPSEAGRLPGEWV